MSIHNIWRIQKMSVIFGWKKKTPYLLLCYIWPCLLVEVFYIIQYFCRQTAKVIRLYICRGCSEHLLSTYMVRTLFPWPVWICFPCNTVLFFKCLALWVKFSADNILKYVFLFFPENRFFNISCKLLSMEKIWLETICLNCQNLLSGKSMKNVINLLSAKLAQR